MVAQPTVRSKEESTANIHRRYRHLFTLPARNRTLAYASIVFLLTTFLARIGNGYSLIQIASLLILTELVLLSSIEIDRRVLKGRNKIATYRRLTSLAIVSGSIWFVLTLAGFILSFITSDHTRLFSLIILGVLFATSFRALIMGSLFFEKHFQAIPLSFVQPILLFVPIGFQFKMLNQSLLLNQSIGPLSALIGGLIALVGIEFYMSSIEKIKISIYRPLELLQAFLNAWAAEDATNLERFLDVTSKETAIISRMLELSTSKGKSAIVVLPGVHPGPFYPIGSSNIPADIFFQLTDGTKILPMVVHSVSDHALNLPSKAQVERYIADLKNHRKVLDAGTAMTAPIVKRLGKATICGIAFGSTVCLTITQAPYGMEDFPVEVREKIEEHSGRKNFRNTLVIDTHNSEGNKPNEQECEDAISAAKDVIDQLAIEVQRDFMIGVSHSSELKDVWIEQDVGPAGIGLILFEVGGQRYSFVTVDSNNSKRGFREEVFEEFRRKTNSEILELCTSDTHVTAAKTSDSKGYLALGDSISSEKFTTILASLYKFAEESLEKGSFKSMSVETKIKTIGSDVLDDFSGLLDSASSEAKHGARILAGICLAITIIVSLI